MIHVPLFITGFSFGTFKFLFAHWTVYGAAVAGDVHLPVYEIFLSVTSGAWLSMTIFYFLSEFLMKRAAIKRHQLFQDAKAKGITLPVKKKFTRMNKGLVKMKRGIGIYGVTLFAPLFLSIPLGSVVCAKFFGHEKKTFPLMLLFTAAYSSLMCTLIWLTQ